MISRRITPPAAVTAIWFLGLASLTALAVARSDGWLIYSLDDAYIHMAVAENILHGGYGVNAGEAAAPSSSILWPLLLAATEFAGLGLAGPLLVNALATGLSVFLLAAFVERHIFRDAPGHSAGAIASGLLLAFAMNAFALPLTGMEHCAHVLLVVLAVDGLARTAEDGRASWPLLIAAVAMPLIRFEGIALSALLIAALMWLGHRRCAAMALALLIAALAAYAVAMHRLGLPYLPSSVMTKSKFAANMFDVGNVVFLVATVITNALDSLRQPMGLALMLIGALLVPGLLRRGGLRLRTSPEAVVAATAIGAIGAHILLVGKYGGFHRYEVYAVTLGLLAAIYVHRRWLAAVVGRRAYLPQIGVAAAMLALAAPYLTATWLTPAAMRNIYQQQFQMQRFATHSGMGPVAVHDLGWVSYRNDNYVLDLIGLGSETVRKARLNGRFDARFVARLAAEHGVRYAMIYEHDGDWYGHIPAGWQKVAVLHTSQVTASFAEVAFYATDASAAPALKAAVARFAPTLPDGATLSLVAP